MNRIIRFLIALAACVGGFALMPLLSVPKGVFGWELFAGVYSEIFADGFESGDTSQWSQTVPLDELQRVPATRADSARLSATIRPAGLRETPAVMVAGISSRQKIVFAVEARRRPDGVDLRARAMRDDGTWARTPWRALEDSERNLEVEWRRALPGAEDGLLYVSVEGRLALWLVDLDNARKPLVELGTGVTESGPTLFGLRISS